MTTNNEATTLGRSLLIEVLEFRPDLWGEVLVHCDIPAFRTPEGLVLIYLQLLAKRIADNLGAVADRPVTAADVAGEESVIVRDLVTRYEVMGNGTYEVTARTGKVTGCSCKGWSFRKTCKHAIATQTVLNAW